MDCGGAKVTCCCWLCRISCTMWCSVELPGAVPRSGGLPIGAVPNSGGLATGGAGGAHEAFRGAGEFGDDVSEAVLEVGAPGGGPGAGRFDVAKCAGGAFIGVDSPMTRRGGVFAFVVGSGSAEVGAPAGCVRGMMSCGENVGELVARPAAAAYVVPCTGCWDLP